MSRSKFDLHLGKTDWALIVISLLGILITSMFLFNDRYFNQLISETTDADRSTLGVVGTLSNDVRRKHKATLTWRDAFQDDSVYVGDSIFTGDDSSAVLELDEGISLELEPNSLVILSEQDDGFQLDLKIGRITAKQAPKAQGNKVRKLRVVQKGKVAKIDLNKKTKIQLSKNKAGDMELLAKSGESKIVVNGQEENLKEAEKVKLNRSLELLKFKEDLMLIYPPDGSGMFLSEEKLIPFKWSGDNKFSLYNLQVADNPEFTKPESLTTEKFSGLIPLNKFTGRELHWRVIGMISSGEEVISNAKKFYVSAIVPPEAITPAMDEEIKYKSDANVSFSWSKVDKADAYLLQVFGRDDLENPIISKEIEYLNTVETLEVGVYHWHIQAISNKTKTKTSFSEKVKFSVIEEITIPVVPDGLAVADPVTAEEQLMESVENQFEKSMTSTLKPPLVKKRSDFKLEFGKIKGSGIKAEQAAVLNYPILKWINQDEGEIYRVQISRSTSFKKLLVNKQVERDEFYKWTSVLPGNFYFRVAALRALNDSGYKWSNLGKIKVTLPAGAIRKSVRITKKYKTYKSYSKKLQKIQVKWPHLPMGLYYSLKVNNRLLNTPIKGEKATVVLDTTIVNSVEVAVSGSKGTAVSDYSSPMKVKVRKILLLKRPKLEFPTGGVSIVSFGDSGGGGDENIFSWTRVKEATSYDVEISKSKSFKKIIYSPTSKSNVFSLEKDLGEGRFYWRVRSVREKFKSKWSKPQSFEL